jgi:hypothetical protein
MERYLRRWILRAADHWWKVAAVLAGVAVAVGAVAALVAGDGNRLEALGLVETCLGVLLAVFIFAWTLSGFALERVDLQQAGRQAFSTEVGNRRYVGGALPDWATQKLAGVLEVPSTRVEEELVLWLVERRTGQGPRVVLAVTRRYWFLRVTAQRGGQVLDLATGRRLDT